MKTNIFDIIKVSTVHNAVNEGYRLKFCYVRDTMKVS